MNAHIERGHIYRGKRPRPARRGEFNDRQVLYIDATKVQYDSPTVGSGRKYPTVDRAAFEKWAGEDVTEGYPEGDWAEYEPRTR